MAVILKDLYETTKDIYALTLVAGEAGLSNCLTWVYSAEDLSTSCFLRENELIISTGMLYDHTTEWLLCFIRNLIRQKCCGLIVNTGKYVSPSDITGAVTSLCNENRFPLFFMPWHIHISDITRDYCDKILSEAHKDKNIDFYRLLCEVKNTSVLERYCSQRLAPVLEYDKKHHTDYTQTLFLYLKYWGNIQDIAAETYYHRNTITNRIRILREIGYNLADPSERFELMSAFMVAGFLKQDLPE